MIEILSRLLKVPKRDITIISGEKSRAKRLRVAGMDRDAVIARLTN